MPAIFMNIYRDFQELDAARTSNGFGVNPITFTEILSFYALNRIEVEPWEVNVLRYFDSLIVNLHSEKAQKETKK